MSDIQKEPYIRTLDDELDWTLLEQLHKVVLQMSDTCFQIKKICVTTEIAVATLLLKFTDNNLDGSFFLAIFLVATLFWLLDSITYFYQVKIRGVMNGITERLKERNDPNSFVDTSGRLIFPVIAPERIEKSTWRRILDSFLNPSMLLYWFFMVLTIIFYIIFSHFKTNL